ncbi:MAG: S-methyl-5'-thioadenosine phosphorylase [Thermomicrobiales bacterium]|nr:S-methyl-5'-thioadenosine phosphorylase [Thermomicrobiales bacterium]MCA9877947.1 S-methyl-5'-thioadenosine phosphorylase [Thermomicrobiales bacterium]
MGRLGVIGGSGIYAIDDLRSATQYDIETPFGQPSGPILEGTLGQTEVLFLPRHGEGHRLSPGEIPYRANVYALKRLGATHLVSFSAVGSLKEELPPRTLVLPDQIIDRTLTRARTFFEGGVVAHVGLADPYCSVLRASLSSAATATAVNVEPGGTYVCIEGPQFSTRAESTLYRSWGASVIGMTAMPEARLAREAELCYAAVAMVTDYDVWHHGAADVTVEEVISNMQANGAAARAILQQLCRDGLPDRTCGCGNALQGAIMTSANAIPNDARAKLDLLAGDRWPA